MKAAKSEGELSRGRMRNSESGHKCWVQALNHFSHINHRMEKVVKKYSPVHKDLATTRMKRDAEAIGRVLQWLEDNNPFDHDRDKQLIVSFSTGFRSTAEDAVNAETATKVGREMQMKLDGQSVSSVMEVKFKVQALSSLRKIPKINEKKIHLNSLKLFNRLILFAQRDMAVQTSLEYELTPFPLSLFSSKDQKMNKANKAVFSTTSLKELTDVLDLTEEPCSSLVVDGGWLLYMMKCEQGQTWLKIVDSYLSFVQCHGTFDTKRKCMDNVHNKNELSRLLILTFRKHQISVEQCDNDADRSIVRRALADATNDSVEVSYFVYDFPLSLLLLIYLLYFVPCHGIVRILKKNSI